MFGLGKKIEVKVTRDWVDEVDEKMERTRTFLVRERGREKNFVKLLIKENYFPEMSGSNSVWMLTSEISSCLGIYYTRTKHIEAPSVWDLIELIGPAKSIHVKYYPDVSILKAEIDAEYKGDMCCMFHDGWLDTYEYCEYLMGLEGVAENEGKK